MLKIRQINADELVLLTIPQDSIKCAYWGSQKPIPDQYILTSSEIAKITAATDAYNYTILNAAKNHNLALVDVNRVMKQIAETGLVVDGVPFTNVFVRGNGFSTDGIHLTPQGNALVANLFIDAINATYNATIPKVNVAEYNAVLLP